MRRALRSELVDRGPQAEAAACRPPAVRGDQEVGVERAGGGDHKGVGKLQGPVTGSKGGRRGCDVAVEGLDVDGYPSEQSSDGCHGVGAAPRWSDERLGQGGGGQHQAVVAVERLAQELPLRRSLGRKP